MIKIAHTYERRLVLQRGQFIVELLVAIGLMTVILPPLTYLMIATRDSQPMREVRAQADQLMQETYESMRSVRERGWSYVNTNGIYHPVVSGTVWSLESGSDTAGNLTRQVTILSVYRDVNGAISSSETGTLDPSTKKIDVLISWNLPHASSIQSTWYLSRYLGNMSRIHTTVADFTPGILTDIQIADVAGGELALAPWLHSSWCNPNLSITSLDLPKSGVANAVSAIEGKIFAGTGDNASGVSFANVAVSNTNPPIATLSGTFSNYKTNAIFGETNYAYIATDTNDREVTIIRINTSPYTEVGTFDAPGVVDGNSVYVAGDVGYLTTGNTFYTFDLTSRTGARPMFDSVPLVGVGNKIYVLGSYAYVAINSTTTQLQIVDVSNPSNIFIVGSAQVSGLGAVDVFVNPEATRAYVATVESATLKEMFIVDVSAKTGSRPTIGSFDSNGMNPKGVTVVTSSFSGNRVILVGVGGEEYQVINIDNELEPIRCGGLQVETGVNGISSVLEADGDPYSYIITGDASQELKIIEGGPDGGNYLSSGIYESPVIDIGQLSVFNRFFATVSQPSQTTVKLQVASASPVSGSCANATYFYVGPDGSQTSYFIVQGNSIEGAVPVGTYGGYTNPNQCFRYKVFFDTTDTNQTPLFTDFEVNYSP